MIPAVVLAAGLSSRMGRVKALLPLGRDTFIGRIVTTFRSAGVDDVVVVVGHEGQAVTEELTRSHPDVRVVVNEAYRAGQLSSLLAGLNAVDRPGVSGMLLTLVDVPLVSVATVRAVIDRSRRTGALVARPVRGDEHGHPVLIDRSLFGALRLADPALGAKAVVRAHVSPAGEVPVDDPGAFLDVDTPEAYARAVAALEP